MKDKIQFIPGTFIEMPSCDNCGHSFGWHESWLIDSDTHELSCKECPKEDND